MPILPWIQDGSAHLERHGRSCVDHVRKSVSREAGEASDRALPVGRTFLEFLEPRKKRWERTSTTFLLEIAADQNLTKSPVSGFMILSAMDGADGYQDSDARNKEEGRKKTVAREGEEEKWDFGDIVTILRMENTYGLPVCDPIKTGVSQFGLGCESERVQSDSQERNPGHGEIKTVGGPR